MPGFFGVRQHGFLIVVVVVHRPGPTFSVTVGADWALWTAISALAIRGFMPMISCSGNRSRSAMLLTCLDFSMKLWNSRKWPCMLRRLTNNFFCEAAVPIFAGDLPRPIVACINGGGGPTGFHG
jgi:hypothetical protein